MNSRFEKLAKYVQTQMKLNARTILEAVIAGDGTCSLADLAGKCDWAAPWTNAFNSARVRINKKIKPLGWELVRFGNEAVLKEIIPAGERKVPIRVPAVGPIIDPKANTNQTRWFI